MPRIRGLSSVPSVVKTGDDWCYAGTCTPLRPPPVLRPLTMKKILGYSVIAVLVLLVGLYVTMQFFLGGIVKSAVNKYGPGITQTKVELQGANISPLSGEGTLNGLAV